MFVVLLLANEDPRCPTGARRAFPVPRDLAVRPQLRVSLAIWGPVRAEIPGPFVDEYGLD